MIESMQQHYIQSAHHMLPIWSHYANENWCMIGYHSVSVIADAIVKGNINFDPEKALEDGFYKTLAKKKKQEAGTTPAVGYPTQHALVVDAAWNTKTGDMEYQGRHLKSGQLVFKKGPFQDATNNIGEFLAIVHALALAQKSNLGNIPIYSDSMTAISWVKRKKANTKLVATERNKEVFELIERAENWLNNHTFSNPVLKWITEQWGENPADFGRK